MKVYIRNIICCIVLGISVTACDDFFDVNPDDKLLGKEYPSTYTELYSGFMGIAASVQSVADQAIFLEGLRGDFLEPTGNATGEIINIYNYVNDLTGNELASPVGYYNVILNANDYLKHATDYYRKNPNAIDESTFDGLIGGAIRYKCWAYMMLAKLYGEAVWLDDPLVEYKDISEYPVIGFDELLNKCILSLTEGYEIKRNSKESRKIDVLNSNVRWTEVLNASGELQWNRFCPTAQMLLTELYLFTGDYPSVIRYGFEVIKSGAEDSESNPSFIVNKAVWNEKWSRLFVAKYSDCRWENMFYIPYNYDMNQTNRLVEFFANGPSCKYYMKPSQLIMDKFNSQVQQDGKLGDARRGRGVTFREENGEMVVYKFTKKHYEDKNWFRNDVPITPYRAADIHLFVIEAMILSGRISEAMALFEDGVGPYYNSAEGKFNPPYDDFPPMLFSTHTFGSNVGIRPRVSLGKVGDGIIKNFTGTEDELKKALHEMVVDETSLESAGESRAMFAMIRAARKWNDNTIVAKRISEKYPEGKQSEIYNKLLEPNNWFIKYDLKK